MLRISIRHFKVNIVKFFNMKRLIFSFLIVLLGSFLYAAEPDSVFVNSNPINKDSCTCKGIKLYGKVKIVSSGADLKVKVVDNWQDISVKVVDNWADECGEWKFVDNWPDFTIQFVDNWEDLMVRFVDNWPGMR